MISKNEEKLIEIFRIVLDLHDDFDVKSVRQISESRWDSLAHVSLVSAIESEFNLRLEISDTEDRMASFASTRLLLEELGL